MICKRGNMTDLFNLIRKEKKRKSAKHAGTNGEGMYLKKRRKNRSTVERKGEGIDLGGKEEMEKGKDKGNEWKGGKKRRKKTRKLWF